VIENGLRAVNIPWAWPKFFRLHAQRIDHLHSEVAPVAITGRDAPITVAPASLREAGNAPIQALSKAIIETPPISAMPIAKLARNEVSFRGFNIFSKNGRASPDR